MAGIDGGYRANLLTISITNAITGFVSPSPRDSIAVGGANTLMLYANFTYGSGGTTAKVWIQTSIDGGVTWFDIANFAFTTSTAKKVSAVVTDPPTALAAGTTPASAALADNTVLSGVIGDRVRAMVTTTGTYGSSTMLAVDMVAKG